MCPPASISPRIGINASSTDEEVMLFLGERKAGDPVPSNIITELNPFSVEPWDSSESIWYLYNSEDGWSCNQLNTFKATQIGYWRSMDHLAIYRDNVTTGRKTTWEFYTGQEPLGNRTGWLMYDYHKVQKACQGISAVQDCNSICRVFFQEGQRANVGDQNSPDREHCSPFSSDNADGEQVESMLLRFLEQTERIAPINVGDQSELDAPEQRYNGSCQDLVTSYSSGDLHAFAEFSKGEYLELEDLNDLESTSSSSDDSSLISSNSDDECFDAEALFRNIENDRSRDTQDEGSNSKFSAATSAKQSHVVIRLSQSAGSNKINYIHSLGEECLLANSSPSDECSPKTCSPVDKPEQRFSASTSASGSCLRGHPKRTHSGSSESSSSSNGSGSKSVARISKLGKKYCCFVAF